MPSFGIILSWGRRELMLQKMLSSVWAGLPLGRVPIRRDRILSKTLAKWRTVKVGEDA